jgi:hypothetical protein
MAGGKHPAIRLGLSIVAVPVCAPPVSVLGQAPSAATFRILENGTDTSWRMRFFDEEVRTASGAIRVRHVSLLVIRDVPPPIEIWVAQDALLKLELPLDHLDLIRSDTLD